MHQRMDISKSSNTSIQLELRVRHMQWILHQGMDISKSSNTSIQLDIRVLQTQWIGHQNMDILTSFNTWSQSNNENNNSSLPKEEKNEYRMKQSHDIENGQKQMRCRICACVPC